MLTIYSRRRRHWLRFFSLLFCFLWTPMLRAQDEGITPRSIPLDGQWRFALDRNDAGKSDYFKNDLPGNDKITLPGILQAQGYGDDISVDTPWVAALPRDFRWYLLPQYAPYTKPGNIKVPYLSQPPKHYLGVAWYQRNIQIPTDWKGRLEHLLLERPHWETTVWVDDKEIGSNNSLVAPHEYVLGTLSPGRHRLTIRIDNRMSVLPGYRPDGHSVSDALGATWNGIAGRIELSATPPVYLDDVQVFPDAENHKIKVKVSVANAGGKAGKGSIFLSVPDPAFKNNERMRSFDSGPLPISWDEKGCDAEFEMDLRTSEFSWSEFSPTLYHLSVGLSGAPDAMDDRLVTFGLRDIKANGLKILLNSREFNFRATHFGGDFPLTGYPATDVDSWKKIFQECKDYGLNGMRFHSWCPPGAAFTAADELGFYLQPECGMWNPFNPGDRISNMLELETARMMKAYGNHPSFVLLSPSNEPAGRWQQVLPQWAAEWYQKDPRRLYAENTGRANPADKMAQFAIVPYRSTGGWFGRDYSASMQGRGGRGPGGAGGGVQVPVITHEVGQWCAYPDYDVIKEFTGYLRPSNYEVFRDSAAAHGVLDRNKDFSWASGKFQVECYKQEIEANLRTPNLSGFELLDLRDYLGQGTALIGVVDAFWKPKSYITAAEYHRFCGPVVPLARLRNYVLRQSDSFEVPVEIANYGPGPIASAVAQWKIVDSTGQSVLLGEWPAKEIPIGKNIALGAVTADLAKLEAPMQYHLVVALAGTPVENDWTFWLYPNDVSSEVPADVLVTTSWHDARERLAAGGKVLFTPALSDLDDTSPPLDNVPVFWNRLMNPKLGAMMGLWVDAKNAALAEFPTDAFCNWQWTDIVRGMRAVNIEKAPKELRPIVSAIDDWNRNYKLGVIFECNVGTGRLMVCAPDIQANLNTHTVARQLRRSLLDYMAGDKFHPTVTLTADQADALWPGPRGVRATQPSRPNAQPGDINEMPSTAPVAR